MGRCDRAGVEVDEAGGDDVQRFECHTVDEFAGPDDLRVRGGGEWFGVEIPTDGVFGVRVSCRAGAAGATLSGACVPAAGGPDADATEALGDPPGGALPGTFHLPCSQAAARLETHSLSATVPLSMVHWQPVLRRRLARPPGGSQLKDALLF